MQFSLSCFCTNSCSLPGSQAVEKGLALLLLQQCKVAANMGNKVYTNEAYIFNEMVAAIGLDMLF